MAAAEPKKETVLAAAAKKEPLPPVINLAAPPVETAAVQLPADVVAAMTVLARFQAQQAAAPAAPGVTQVAAVQH